MTAGRWLRRLLDPDLREIGRLRHHYHGTLLQPATLTWDDRYPAIFDALASRLEGRAPPEILSFGCSSGAEVRALRKRLPTARITGVDLNTRSLLRARKEDPLNASDYICADRPPAHRQFDAILALAVFRHGDLAANRPESSTDCFPFARFRDAIERIDAALVPGGWLALCSMHFAFEDLAIASRYEADPLRLPDLNGEVRYGSNDLMSEASPQPVLWRKRES